MPAGLPGDTLFNNQGNPNAGKFVTFDPLSGPKDAPLDAKYIDYSTGTPPGWNASTKIPILLNDDSNISTGGLSTGVGMSCGGSVIKQTPGQYPATAAKAIFNAGFTDNNIPGEQNLTYDAGGPPPVVATHEIDSTFLYIGGGRSSSSGAPNPYTAGIAICGAGNGGSRDSGANTGFAMKMVTATGAVANGAAVETGSVNRSGVALASGDSVYGSASAALAAAS